MLLNINISPTSTASVSINEVSGGEYVAPFGMFLEATGHSGFDENGPSGADSYDPTHDKFVYIWTVSGNPLSILNTAGELNVPTIWRDPNVMYGPRVAFVLPVGSFTINLWCIELASGKTATASWVQTIADPDAVYTGTRTAVFAADGIFTGKPTGAVECTTEAQCEAFFAGLTSQTGRLLFKRGEDTTFADDIGVASAQNFRVGTWGAGARPIVRAVGGFLFGLFNSLTTDDMVVEGIRLLASEWDSTREKGKPGTPFNWAAGAKTNPMMVVTDCEIHGNFNLYSTANTGRAILHDSYIHDWGGNSARYGWFVNGAYAAVLFSAIKDKPDTCIGSKQGPFQNYGAAYRDNGKNNRVTVLAGSSFFCAAGWSDDSNLASAQPAMRLNTDGSANAKIVLDRVVAEGGRHVIDGVENNANTCFPCNFVADKVLVVPDARNRASVVNWNFNGTWRNVVAVYPNIQYLQAPTDRTMMAFTPSNVAGNAEYLSAPCRFYNCTVINLHPTVTVTPFLNNTSDANSLNFSDYAATNNIEQDAAGGQTADAPISTATALAGFTPTSTGIRWSVTKPKPTLGANVSGAGGTLNVSYPVQHYVTSPGLVRTTKNMVNTDFQAGDGHAVYNQTTGTYFYEEDGAISLDFSSGANAVVTNNSGTQWNSGAVLVINLVPKDASNPTDTFFASSSTVPIPRPTTGSAAIGSATGVDAYDDFELTVRPTTGADRGAVEAA